MALAKADRDLLATHAEQLRAASTWISGPRSRVLATVASDLERLVEGEKATALLEEKQPEPVAEPAPEAAAPVA